MTNFMKHDRNFKFLIFSTLMIAILAACSGNPPGQSAASGSSANPASSNASGQSAATPANSGDVSFSKEISPILQAACVKCHGGEKTSKGLDLKTFDSLMVGSQNGAVIVAGDPTGSKLIQSVQSGKMPKNGPKLTPDQIQILVNWVNAGAKNN